jgi:hypothetical protein
MPLRLDDPKGFFTRNNRNGTYDAICLQCFLTIATSSTERDLEAMVKFHHCHGLPKPLFNHHPHNPYLASGVAP